MVKPTKPRPMHRIFPDCSKCPYRLRVEDPAKLLQETFKLLRQWFPTVRLGDKQGE